MYYSSMFTSMPSYTIQDYKVFFGNQYISNARWSDFKDLGQGYGKDGNHVFFMGQILQRADPYSFQVLDAAYAKDYQHVFHYGEILRDLKPHSLQSSINCNNELMSNQPMYPLHMGTNMSTSMNTVPTEMPLYEIRDFKVFFHNQYIPAARWIDFTNLGHGYGKDVHHVFYAGHIISEAHSFSFEVLNKGYAKDKNHVFYKGQIVQGLQPFGFQIPQDSTTKRY